MKIENHKSKDLLQEPETGLEGAAYSADADQQRAQVGGGKTLEKECCCSQNRFCGMRGRQLTLHDGACRIPHVG